MEKLLPDIAANSMGFAVAPERYRPYPAYRDSGVEWLGEVPAHWVVARMWQVSEAISGGTPERDEPRYWDGTIPWVSPKDMKRRLIGYTEEGITECGRRDAGLKLINPPAVLVVVRGMILAHSFPVAVSTVPLSINQDMKALKLRADMVPRFFGWLLDGISRRILSTVVEKAAHGTRAIRMDDWRSVDLPLPPVDEQRTVVDFLDFETAKIDALVATKERLIELLQERRTALITRAVTKGLDPDAPMKDSGIDWLGEIPSHWGVRKLKSMVPGVTVGIVVTPSKYYVEDGIPCLRSLNIAQGSVTTDNLVSISESANTLHRKSQIFAGDIVVVRTGRAGTAVVVPPEFDGANCVDLLIIRQSNRLHSRFLYYFMNSGAVRGQVMAESVGSIQEHYNTSTLANLVTPKMPIQEQRSIAGYLDRRTARIDALVAKVHEVIDRLKELRTTLIAAAVTGKIDVRETPT